MRVIPARGYSISATPGIISAYRAGLSINDITILWGIKRGRVHRMLRCAEVEMRKGVHRKPSATVYAHYSVVAKMEIANGLLMGKPKPCATAGMIAAYDACLTTHEIGDLWGGLGCQAVGFRLRNAGVELRTGGLRPAADRPSKSVIDHFRAVAAAEMQQGEEAPAVQAGVTTTPGAAGPGRTSTETL